MLNGILSKILEDQQTGALSTPVTANHGILAQGLRAAKLRGFVPNGLLGQFANLGRKPYPSESTYFQENPSVSGMATEDGRIALNPFSNLSPQQYGAVGMNEAARLAMRNDNLRPSFSLTPQQSSMLGGTTYANANEGDRRATIAARFLSGDDSAGTPTQEQLDFIKKLRQAMRIK